MSLFSFEGRVTRTYFWTVYVVFMVISIGCFVAGSILGFFVDKNVFLGITGVLAVAFIVALVAHLSAVVRRYHDRNKSGWWFFIAFIPFIGPLWQLVELGFLKGTEGDNEYGSAGAQAISTIPVEPTPTPTPAQPQAEVAPTPTGTVDEVTSQPEVSPTQSQTTTEQAQAEAAPVAETVPQAEVPAAPQAASSEVPAEAQAPQA